MSKDEQQLSEGAKLSDGELSPSAPAHRGSVARTSKGKWDRLWPVIACGAGLFSDGYLNNVRSAPAWLLKQMLNWLQIIGPVNTILKRLYPDAYANSSAQANVASITFAGTVLGMLIFGYTSDHYSRKWSLLV